MKQVRATRTPRCKAINDEFTGAMGGGDVLVGHRGQVAATRFKGLGTKVATQMLGPDGTKALAPSGATVVGQEFVRDPVALGQVAQSLLDVLPTKQHTSAEYAYLAQTTRTNTAAVVGVRPAESVELGTRHGASQP